MRARYVYFVLLAGLALTVTSIVRPVAAAPAEIVSNQSESDVCLRHARGLFLKGARKQALFYVDKAIDKNPRNAEALCLKGRLAWGDDDAEGAIKAINAGLKLKPDIVDWQVFDCLGAAYYVQGKKAEALKAYDRELQLQPGRHELYFNRANIYIDWKQNDKAVAELSRGIERNPKASFLYNTRGSLYMTMGENKKALLDMTTAIKLYPTDYPLYAKRAKIYDALGQKALAAADRKIVDERGARTLD